MTTLGIMTAVLILLILAYNRAPLWLTTLVFIGYLACISYLNLMGWAAQATHWIIILSILALINIRPLRRQWLTRHLFAIFRKFKPKLSPTEKQAISVGTVGWEGQLFTGMPRWSKMLSYSPDRLADREQQFLDGPVEQLCQMIDNWHITHKLRDIPDEIWRFLKDKRFFGMIIPKEYGGLAFSARAHSEVLVKLASRSISIATVVSVPNSLGPGELLLNYGTEQQKNYYLPRLAKGKDIPAFALTSQQAGSNATAIIDHGVVCQAEFEGKTQTCIKLNWDKRYITLGPVATVLGLAFRLYDPEHLLSETNNLGITCALIPTHLPGVNIGRRHFPLDAAFPNGPTQGQDVIVPVDYIIGGSDKAGWGWQMIVECLSVGRAISLPSMVTGGAKMGVYATGAYVRIREQFDQPIGYFEGIEEPLARIAGNAFIMDTMRSFTLAAIDRGEKPVIPAAMCKYHVTERGRQVANDTMDIHGGKGICMGPNNIVAQGYQETPISITVEGANILTRSMLIFGQGAIRCHPYLLDELQAAESKDTKAGLKEFDQALTGHAGYLISNAVRSLWLALTQGRLVMPPRRMKNRKVSRRYFQKLTRVSAAFALASDVVMIVMGGQFKRRERLSARFADILSYLYMGSAILKAYELHDGRDDLAPVVQWSCQHLLHQAQQQLDALLTNMPNRVTAKLLRWFIFPLGKRISVPSDQLDHEIARTLLEPNGVRSLLAWGAYVTDDGHNPSAFLENVLKQVVEAAPLERKVKRAVKDKRIQALAFEDQLRQAVELELITQDEADHLLRVHALRMQAIQVDDFDPSELTGR